MLDPRRHTGPMSDLESYSLEQLFNAHRGAMLGAMAMAEGRDCDQVGHFLYHAQRILAEIVSRHTVDADIVEDDDDANPHFSYFWQGAR